METIDVVCPYCQVKVTIPFYAYDFNGDFVHTKGECVCPRCGYPIRFSTDELEKQLT